MCIFKNKWTKFTPTDGYLSAVKSITSVNKLYNFIQKFQYTGEKGDVWQNPEEFLKNEHLDCDDFMRFTVDVLRRVMGINAKGVIHSGYNKAKWGNKIKHHAICIFPYQNKLAIFSNKELFIGLSNYEGAGHITFPDGLKYQEIRDWQGKILEKKRQWFGTF